MINLRVLTVIIFLLPAITTAQIKMPKLISDGMILQRNTSVKIWGWASPGEDIKLTFKDEIFSTTAGPDSSWHILLPKQPAGGPYKMFFKGRNKITVSNIMFGDVWVASGQSNMELTMERVKERYAHEIQRSANPAIRQFLVPDEYDFKKENKDLSGGQWVEASPETILNFSAVAYFFAKRIHDEYNTPIGIINAALGGSPVEAWMSEETLKQFPMAYNELQKFKNDSLINAIETSDRARIKDWYDELESKDLGIKNKWHLNNLNDSSWSYFDLPGFWEDYKPGDVNGVVWFRKELQIPKEMAGKPAKLWLGRIVDQDFVYLNGELVGTTGYQYPPRRYSVQPGILKEGKNVISVRVINQSGAGGFITDKPYYLASGTDTIDLKGTWKYKLGTTMDSLGSQTFIRWKPGGLYNKMIAPLLNYKIKGVIWYQGESNTSDPSKYREYFPTLINSWRASWNSGEFPFLYVQLANFMTEIYEPSQSQWAELREAQRNTLSVPKTGMAVTIDLGEWNDIHPVNKKDVGERLALEAKEVAYYDPSPSSPTPVSATFKDNSVIITFKDVGEGLVSKNNKELTYFQFDNGLDYWAKAEIIAYNKVKVWSSPSRSPKIVRYAWANNPATANLYNSYGLPVSPFEIRIEDQ